MPTLLSPSRRPRRAALKRNRTARQRARGRKALVLAEADGIKGHGLSRVPIYAAQAKVGKVDGFATPAVTRTRSRR